MTRVLVVDDNEDVLEMLEEALASRGWNVTGAASAKRARHRIATKEFDVVVIDYAIPGESGLSFAKFANAQGLPVLLISGYPTEDLAHGPYPYLEKPFGLEDIVAALDCVLADVKRDA